LKDELESMMAFLQDLSEKDEHRRQIKIWMKQVREVAYDVVDHPVRFNLSAKISQPFNSVFLSQQISISISISRSAVFLQTAEQELMNLNTTLVTTATTTAEVLHL
jgi:hypothetical protein